MLEFTVSSTQRLPVVLKSTSGTAFNGAAYNAVAFSIVKANGVQYDLTLVSASWQQITGTAYLNQGYYNYIMTGSDLDTTGVFQYCVYISGAVPYFGVVKVVDGDTGAIYNRIGMPVSGSISNDIQNIPTSVASGGFGASDRALLSATYATVSLLPSDPASNSYLSGVIHAIDPTTNILAIKAKTDNLPSDPVGISSMNGALTQTISTIDAHTDGQFTVIKGGSWTTQTLYDIGLHVSQTWYSATFVPWLNSTDALTYFSKTWGDGFVTGTDDLHGLSLQIQGITPGSGGGGFSSADRAALYATYTATLPLPSDPASESQLSGVIHSSTLNILGLYPYGAASQSVPAYTSYTLYQVWQTESLIKSSTDHLPTIGTVATVTDVNNARDYLAGTGYVQASNSLVAITNLITASNFTPTDRAVLDGISASVGFGLTGTANSILSDVVAIKAKTDLLPNDVVSSSSIFPVLYDISASLGASGGFSTSDRDNIIYISQTLGKPQAATVSADILGIINTQATQGTTITNIFSKVNNLPVDPASNTFVNQVSQELRGRLDAAGFQARETPLNEFIKSGGGAKCLTLRLTEPEPLQAKSATTVRSRDLKLEGHLL